jgi:hypothetical protein
MRLPKIPTIAVPLAASAALALAGCGGGGSDSTATTVPATTETTPTLSKEELISRGDAICGEVNAAVGSAASSDAEPSSQMERVADLYTGMVESIKRLGTPAEPAGYSEFLTAAEALSKVEGEVKLAAEREDSAALGEATAKAAPALEEFQTAAGEYGFEDCSEGPSAPPVAGSGSATAEEEAGGVEAAPEASEEAEVEEAAPEEVAPETGGAGSGAEETAPEGGGAGGGTSGGGSGGIGPG